MPRALEIPIEIPGLNRAVDGLRQLARGVQDVGTAGGRGGGPALALRRAVAGQVRAMGEGDPAGMFDAELRLLRARRSMERARRELAGGPTTADRLTTLIRSTRFGAGGAMPLVGRTADALGIPLAGGAGLALAGGAVAVGAFVAAIKVATENLNTFGEAMRLTGGAAGDVAGMARFGLRGGAAAAAAASFRQRISTDPMSMMFAARLGVRALPRPFGQVNEAETYNRAATAVLHMTNAEERLRYARQLDMPEVLRLAEASERVRAARERLIRTEEQMAGGAKSANDLAVSLETMHSAIEDLLTLLVTKTGIIPAITSAILDLTEALQGNWAAIGRTALLWKGVVDLLNPSTAGQGIAEIWTAMQQSAAAEKDHTDAMNKHTDALDKSADAMKAYLPPGTYGGGARTAGAAPAGWSGDYLARQMESGALAKGSL